MLYALISILGIVLTIFFVVGTHEFGHFIAARLLGVKVLRFSIGFGKTLLCFTDKKNTEYVFALIPLGGYVKMLDEGEGNVPKEELPFAYNYQPFYKKFLIIAAGPAMNLFCAFLLYWSIFMMGFVTVKPLIGEVKAHSIAAESGLRPNLEILSVDNKAVTTWTSILLRILFHIGNEDKLAIAAKSLSESKIQTYYLNLSDWHMDKLTPDPLASLGLTPYEPKIPLLIGSIIADSPAATSPLKIGDKIQALNGQPAKNWDNVITTILNHPEQTILFTIDRQGKTLQFPVVIGVKKTIFLQKTGYLGIAPTFSWPKELLNHVQYGPLAAIPHAAQQIADLTYFNFILFGKLVTGKISVQSLGGPITIFSNAGTSLNYGFMPFLGFLAFLSIAIGVINILPIPGLDGGHLLIQTIETVIRRPLPQQFLLLLYRLGFLIILYVLFQSLINDILRLQ